MSSERHQHVKAIFLEAVDLAEPQREAYLQTSCQNDAELRRKVEALLAQDTATDDAFDDQAIAQGRSGLDALVAAAESGGQGAPIDAATAPLPERIGNYEIVRQVGAGGMGLVFEAVQRHPHRTVALKIVRPDLTTHALIKRFKFEAEALGQLSHPGVAHVYEAGSAEVATSLGTRVTSPFLAMELIHGAPIDEYANHHNLSIADRLELVAKACDAVHHAHQHGVIHRDLKPGNILVEESGQPKILDFGVAQLVDADKHLTTIQTQVGQLVGTVSYMSPEQLTGDTRRLDTQTDVYALGVILYEVLSGKLPYDIRGRSLAEAARIRQDKNPTALSAVTPRLRGDVETIVQKALERDKERRYSSAAEFAADIRRYLNDEPIVARPPSTRYLLGKFVRRHRMFVAGAASFMLLLIVGTAVSVSQAVRARRAERLAQERLHEAQEQKEVAEAINKFLNEDLLSAVHPDQARDRNVTVREILDEASRNVEHGSLADNPVVEASVRQTLGTTYTALGRFEEARKHLEAALGIRKTALGPYHTDTLMSIANLGMLEVAEGHYHKAAKLLGDAFAEADKRYGDDEPCMRALLENLSKAYGNLGDYGTAEKLHLRLMRALDQYVGQDEIETLKAKNDLAVLYHYMGRFADAQRVQEETLAAQRRVLGDNHADTLMSMMNLAYLHESRGRFDKAEALYNEVLDRQEKTLGPDHPFTLNTMGNLGLLYFSEGRYDDAERLDQETIERRRRVLGPEHPFTLTAMGNLADVYTAQRRYNEAEKLYRETLEIQRRTLGPEHPSTLAVSNNLALMYQTLGRYAEAAKLFEASLDAQVAQTGEAYVDALIYRNNLARALCLSGDVAAADRHFARVQELAPKVLPEGDWMLGHFLVCRGECLLATDRFKEARDALQQGHDILAATLGPDHHRTKEAREKLDEAVAKLKKVNTPPATATP